MLYEVDALPDAAAAATGGGAAVAAPPEDPSPGTCRPAPADGSETAGLPTVGAPRRNNAGPRTHPADGQPEGARIHGGPASTAGRGSESAAWPARPPPDNYPGMVSSLSESPDSGWDVRPAATAAAAGPASGTGDLAGHRSVPPRLSVGDVSMGESAYCSRAAWLVVSQCQ